MSEIVDYAGQCVLVAIPMKSSLNDQLRQRMLDQVERLPTNNGSLKVELGLYEHTPKSEPQKGSPSYVLQRSINLCAARNELIAEHLEPHHDWVLWIDADIVEYPADLPLRLLKGAPPGIIAPMLLLEGSSHYYDTFTHVDAHRRQASASPPYFENGAQFVEMSCVGGCYIMPADILRKWQYTPHDGPGMEHWKLHQMASAHGIRVIVRKDVRVFHAYLPRWGEEFH